MPAIENADKTPRSFPQQEPIAIIGIGCRYSGNINNLDDFWQMLIQKKSTLSDIPEDRFENVHSLIDPERGFRKIVTGKGGWLQQLKEFDAKFFKISPREAEKVDPHQRLMLEVTFEALEDAGLKLEDVWGSRTGVYAGMWSSDFEHVLINSKDDIDVYSTTGSGRYAASGRLAYFFNLQGPTFTIDTACSTSLVAVHLAAQSLHLRECDMAICSAANLILSPFISIGYSRSKLLSDYGKCRFGASEASGYVRTEGAATVILKRLSDAERDGDFIHAIIPGTACNSDGQSHKYMLAPSAVTQEIMIRDALSRAGIAPHLVQYVEAHGTGTKAGDPVELASIPAALSEGRAPGDKFYVGSIKTNLGHTEAASGFAGMIKTILAIQNRIIPGNLYAEEDKNPNIPWDELPLIIPAEATPWPHPERPLLAGVNSFGISGTNAHVLLQEAPPRKTSTPSYQRKWKLFPVSAANDQALQQYLEKYIPLVQSITSEDELLNLVKNVAIRKADLPQRAVVLFEDKQTLLDGLQALLNRETHESIWTGYAEERKGAALVFPGQGAQWQTMGKELYATEPVFRETIDACEAAFSKYVSWSLKEELFSENGMQTIDVIQPALVAMEIALAQWWISNGLIFQAVVGHSMGEVAAAYIAGMINLDEAARIICTRSSLMKRTAGKGAMGYIAISPDEVTRMISGMEDKISIGVINSPASCVISGETDAVDAMLSKAEEQGIFSRRVKVDVASHSPQMDPLLAELKKELAGIHPKKSPIYFYSTVKAATVEGDKLDNEYWSANLRQTVRFAETIQLMAAEGYGHFVEMSPHPTLLQAISENSEVAERGLHASGSLEREKDELHSLMKNLASYYAAGGRINWKKLYGTDFRRITLPAYPFQREKYWVEPLENSGHTGIGRRKASRTAHPFLMQQMDTPQGSGLHIWELALSIEAFPYLADHKVQDAVVVPGAAYIEMLLAVAEELAGAGKHLLKKVELKRALPLKEQEARLIQIVLQHRIAETYDAFIYSLEGEPDEEEWLLNAAAILQINTSTERLLPNALPIDIIERTLEETLTAEQHYQLTREIHLPYGPAFQTIERVRLGENFILADVAISPKVRLSAAKYLIHPSVLDGCIQAFLCSIYRDENKGTFIPVSVGKIELHHYDRQIEKCVAAVKITAESGNQVTGNAVIYSPEGMVILEMRDFTLERLEQTNGENDNLSELLYEVVNIPADLPQKSAKKVLLFEPNDLSISFNATLEAKFIVKKGERFERNGTLITINPADKDHYRQLWEVVYDQIDTVVHAWSLDEKDISGWNAQGNTTLSVAKIIQTFENDDNRLRLWVITGDTSRYPAMAPVAGMLHVMRNEHPEWKPSHLELQHYDEPSCTAIIHSDTPEMQWLLDGSVKVARLQHPSEVAEISVETHSVPAGNVPFEAIIDEPGILDNISFREKKLLQPAPHQVQIAVQALGINFMNLMSALGIYPGKENGFATLGIECVGEVTAVGSEVHHLQPGDRVFGMAYHSMASHILADAALMRKIPAHLNDEEAATIPVVFLTAYYALITLGRLQKGERVLIHAATGGVGLAAVQVAQYVGAEIFATAGSREKREMLRGMGIQYVYDSRTSDFSDRIMRDTSGEGVDVVLNSLTGDAMAESLNLLRSFGRFIEIGKKDVYADSKIGLKAFSKGLSYFMVDFEKMIFEKAAYVGQLLEEIIPFFEKGIFQPLPKKTFPIAKAKDAFEYMSSGKHTGKIVIRVSPENVLIQKKPPEGFPVVEDGTYLLTGGYGGLGLTFAHYLADKGATSLILTGRTGPSENAIYQMDLLRSRGVSVYIEKMDVGNEVDIQKVLKNIPPDKPLKGIFHLAGLLEDASLMNLEEAAFYRVLHPKVTGAYLLHQATRDLSLDHFVLFSSSTILFGSPGQTAYVAANSYMDALARYRKQQGLPALSVQWGTVSDVGMAAAAGNRADRLADEGIAPLSPEECPILLEMAARYHRPVMGAFRFDIAKWEAHYRPAANNPLYALLRSETESTTKEADSEASFVSLLNQIADPELRLLSIEDKLKEKVGWVVKLSPDQISNKTPFKSLGIDSLMSIQLKNQLEKVFEISISVTSFWTHPNIRDYARFLMDKLQLSDNNEEPTDAASSSGAAAKTTSPPKDPAVPKEDISLDDLSKLLEDELSDI